MRFLADLHIHSKFSRATAKNLDFENLYVAAQQKGITVLATGDFTHPGWIQEIQDKLVPAEPGLYKLDPKLARRVNQSVPLACHGKVRFILVAEISSIYKKNGQTRKNHNLIFVPDMRSAQNITRRLKKIGNIESDGRPILGLDAKELLKIVLDTHDKAFLVPAHIWTPWFSLLGSKSGFNSISECFEELTPYIFAVETGLSSDPEMNWRVSDLDGLTLISNSDAHSPQKVGREANIFETDLSYADIWIALKTGDPKKFKGTLEFYPEEGKYHLDGHRKCDIRLWPEESLGLDCNCPVCGKPLTLGVLHRVETLADRPYGQKPKKHHPFHKILPLQDILADMYTVGPNTKRVRQQYIELLSEFGSELSILNDIDPDAFQQQGWHLLAEAIRRIRSGQIQIAPGYDGEFGKLKLFNSQERRQIEGQTSLFTDKEKSLTADFNQFESRIQTLLISKKTVASAQPDPVVSKPVQSYLSELNDEQRNAVEHSSGPLLIVAGPGAGKTRTLTSRMAHLIHGDGFDPENILAITFTIKAADEMHQRLKALVVDTIPLPLVTTFHGFCYQLLSDWGVLEGMRIIDDRDQKSLILRVIHACNKKSPAVFTDTDSIIKQIVAAKQKVISPENLVESKGHIKDDRFVVGVYRSYQELIASQGLLDYEDLIFKVVHRFETDPAVAKQYQNRFKHILVDEYQDLNHGQYRLLKTLAPPDKNIFVIGDPNQSIYGFRGSNSAYFERFQNDYPQATVIKLYQNYRSTQIILDASYQLLSQETNQIPYSSKVSAKTIGHHKIGIIESQSEQAETVFVGQKIEQLVGGIGLHSIDFGNIEPNQNGKTYGFADMAILFRTRHQIKNFANRFTDVGIPFQINDKAMLLDRDGIREIVSLYKILVRQGSFKDIEHLLVMAGPKPSRQSLYQFFDWALENRFSVSEAIETAKEKQINRIAPTQQKRLADFFMRITDSRKIHLDRPIETVLQQLFEFLVKRQVINDPVPPRLFERFESLVQMAQPYNRNIEVFLRDLALKKDTDFYDSKAQSVALMTMHAAKGLEFPVVFICGCEEGMIPYRHLKDGISDLQEESRLFYVAMTRAKERLYVSYAKRRSHYGRVVPTQPSPFIARIADELIRIQKARSRRRSTPRGPTQLDLF